MTGIAAATDIGTLAQVLANAQTAQQSIATLTAQTSSGYISSDYAGLGSGAAQALDLAPQLALNQTAQNNADQAGAVMQASQAALGQIEGIASSFAAGMAGIETDSSSMDTLAASARDALGQMANLLDTKVGDIYVFAGQDSRNPPVPNADAMTSSAFYTAIQTAVSGLTTAGATATAAATLAIASPGGTSPYSATLLASNQPAITDLGAAGTLQVGVLADQNSNAVSAGIGTTSTGSYMSDIFRGLATIGSMTSAQASDPNFLPFVQNTIAGLQGAVSAINTDIGALGDRQNQASSAKTELGTVATALTGQLSAVRDVNFASASAQLSQAQTRLQASYQLIATLSQYSLARMLPPA